MPKTYHYRDAEREKQVVLPPHNLKGCPCQPIVDDVLEEHADKVRKKLEKALPFDRSRIARYEIQAPKIELNVEVCLKLKCKYLLKTKHGAYRCSRFMSELRGRKRGAMRATKTLRMRGGDKDGWRYRDLP